MDHKKENEFEANSVSSGVAPTKHVFYDPSKESFWTHAGLNLKSFKCAPGTTGNQVVAGTANVKDLEKVMANAPMLQQKMKPRHLQMIAGGGSISTGLFIGSGSALHNGGPASVLIAWLLIGTMLINVTQAIGEMSILYLIFGGFYTLAVHFLDPAFAFAMGWNYVLQWVAVLPLKITVAGTTVQYWKAAADVDIAVWITIFWIIITIISLFGTVGFSEEEFWSSCLKLLVVVMFIFISIICICGSGPSSRQYNTYLGGTYWHNPRAFSNGLKGVCAVFVTATFSFASTELVGLATSETPNPHETMPSTVKGTFWCITIIYVMLLTIIGLLIPWDEPRLLGGGGAAASPFVIALDNAKIYSLNHFVNITICISVLSIGMSCIYARSQTLVALAETGYAPKIFAYIDKSGHPLWALLFVLLWALLGYVNVVAAGDTIFTWLLALFGLLTLFSWGAICLCHICFRRVWKVQGHLLEELPYQAIGSVYGSRFGVVLILLVFIAQFYIALWPIGGMSDDPGKVAQSFFSVYLALPIMIACYVIGYAWKCTLPQQAHKIDLDSGHKSWLTVEEMCKWHTERKHAPLYICIYHILFTH